MLKFTLPEHNNTYSQPACLSKPVLSQDTYVVRSVQEKRNVDKRVYYILDCRADLNTIIVCLQDAYL